MKRIRTVLGLPKASEDGFTIIEVMVAMMVFAIIAVGIAYSLTTTLTATRDSRAREVASNLAAQQIDNARSFQNVFTVDSGTTTQVVDGTTYTIKQTVAWNSSSGTSAPCGTAGGLLQTKSVNVSVTWSGARTTGSAVTANTMLAPSGPLNDPSMGTILVHVTNAAGVGVPGVAVSAKPDSSVSGNTAQTPNPAPPATDSDGCSYVLKVVPGSYVVTIGTSGDGYIGSTQQPMPSKPVQVKANDSVPVELTYDKASSVSFSYASNTSLTNARFPTSMDMSMASVNTIDTVTAANPLKVFPYPSGYWFFAGNARAPNGQSPACLSVDPGNWTTPNAAGAVGARTDQVNTAPGASASATVSLGSVTVNVGNTYIMAVSATAGAGIGDPGCAQGMRYLFSKLVSAPTVIALPYGSWTLYKESTSTSTSTSNPIALSSLTLPAGTPTTGTTVFTMDPRVIGS